MSLPNMVNEALPLIGGAAGMSVGAVTELVIDQKIAAAQQAVSGEWGKVFGDRNPGRIRRMGTIAVAPLAIAGGLAGAWIGTTMQGETPTVAPETAVIVDHAGADSHEAINGINKVTLSFDNVGVRALAFIAGTNDVSTDVPISKVDDPAYSPFGDAPIEKAFGKAFDHLGESKGHSAAVLVTNGHSAHANSSLIDRAKTDDISVSVIDVDDTTPTNSSELKDLAEQTHGKYWAVSSGDKGLGNKSDDMAKEVVTGLGAKEDNNRPSPNKWPIRTLSIVGSGLGFFGIYRKRYTLSGGTTVKTKGRK